MKQPLDSLDIESLRELRKDLVARHKRARSNFDFYTADEYADTIKYIDARVKQLTEKKEGHVS